MKGAILSLKFVCYSWYFESADIIDSGLTQKQTESHPEQYEQSSSVLEFVEYLVFQEEGKHFHIPNHHSHPPSHWYTVFKQRIASFFFRVFHTEV